MSRGLLLVLVSSLALLQFVAAEIPSYIHVCGRRNPKLNECVIESVQSLVPKLKGGIPELNVPPLEPLYVDRVPLAQLPDFTAEAANVSLIGLSNFNVQHLSVDLEKQRIELHTFFPKISLKADYDVQAKILVPISQKGPIQSDTENVTAKATMKFETVERRGRKLMYFPTMTMKLTIPNYTATFDSATGEQALAQVINSVLQDSQKDIIESMTPNLEKAISKMALDLSNKIVKNFSYDELFPDRE